MKTFFYDVDTQNDFINPDGALYIKGAELLKPNLKALTDYAIKNKIMILGSVDKHFGTDDYQYIETELSKWGGFFPDHCISQCYGQKKIAETIVSNSLFVDSAQKQQYNVSDLLKYEQIMFEKQSYDVFFSPYNLGGNKNIFNIIRDLSENQVVNIIVYGVATDYCVKAATLDLLKHGVQVYVVKDAIKAVNVNQNDEYQSITEMLNAGAIFRNTNDILTQ
jgi:nicotinamidase/pyrazinamidase